MAIIKISVFEIPGVGSLHRNSFHRIFTSSNWFQGICHFLEIRFIEYVTSSKFVSSKTRQNDPRPRFLTGIFFQPDPRLPKLTLLWNETPYGPSVAQKSAW